MFSVSVPPPPFTTSPVLSVPVVEAGVQGVEDRRDRLVRRGAVDRLADLACHGDCALRRDGRGGGCHRGVDLRHGRRRRRHAGQEADTGGGGSRAAVAVDLGRRVDGSGEGVGGAFLEVADREVRTLGAVVDRDGNVVDVERARRQRIREEGEAGRVGRAVVEALEDRGDDLRVAHADEAALILGRRGEVADRGEVGAVAGRAVEVLEAKRVGRAAEQSHVDALDGSHESSPRLCSRRLSVVQVTVRRGCPARSGTTVRHVTQGVFVTRATGGLLSSRDNVALEAPQGKELVTLGSPRRPSNGSCRRSAYRSQRNEKWLAAKILVSRIHRRKPAGKPMPQNIARANAAYDASRMEPSPSPRQPASENWLLRVSSLRWDDAAPVIARDGPTD